MFLNPQNAEYKISEVLNDEVYNVSDSSHIVQLLKAFVGSGIGYFRKQYLLAQLRNNLATTNFSDIDDIYGKTLGLHRLKSESYTHSANKMTADSRVECLAKDAQYKTRIFKYLAAMNIGCTETGIKFMCEASTGRSCHRFVDSKELSVVIADSEFTIPYDSDILEYGDIIVTPPDPVREGYLFLGWYTKPSGGEQISSGQAVSSEDDIVLYAQWRIND